MNAVRLAFAVAVAAAPLPRLMAQDVATRLEGRVSPNVGRAVQTIAQDAAASGLPVELLIQKALEGGAKGVPDDRVIAAVRVLAVQLDQARGALRDAGIQAPSPQAVEGGAYAISTGLNANQVRDLGRVSRPPYDPALTLRVAATLTALGVSPRQGLQLMTHMIQAGRAPGDLLDLPNEVQLVMAHGATPAQAAEALDVEGREHEHEGPQDRQDEQDKPRPRKP